MTEQFANAVIGVSIATAVNNIATTVVVNTATGLPTSGTFRILVETEIMLVTAVSGTNLTVTRGAEGSTAAGHAAGVSISNILTAGAIQQLKTDLGGSSTLDLSLNGFRLTLTSGVPITTGDVTAAANLYFTPHLSDQIALYNGTSWELLTSGEIVLGLSGLTSTDVYDVFAYDNSGTLTLELSAAWASSTTRTDALARQDGVLVKSSNHTRRWIGTLVATGTGTTEDSVTNRYLFNSQNRAYRKLKISTATSSWTYNVAAWRQANADPNIQCNYVTGDAGVGVSARLVGSSSPGGTIGKAIVGIGIDSTTVNSADVMGSNNVSGTSIQMQAMYSGYPGLGKHTLVWLEYADSNNPTFYGDFNSTFWNMGLVGEIWA